MVMILAVKVFITTTNMQFKQFIAKFKDTGTFSVRTISPSSLEEQAKKELYEELSDKTIANIIKEHHDIKVTDTLVESYKQLASSTIFSVDPVVHQIRSLNKLDRLVENKLHYVLNDESIVAIDTRTQDKLNNLLQNQTEVIEYMRESKHNFLYVLEKLEEN